MKKRILIYLISMLVVVIGIGIVYYFHGTVINNAIYRCISTIQNSFQTVKGWFIR